MNKENKNTDQEEKIKYIAYCDKCASKCEIELLEDIGRRLKHCGYCGERVKYRKADEIIINKQKIIIEIENLVFIKDIEEIKIYVYEKRANELKFITEFRDSWMPMIMDLNELEHYSTKWYVNNIKGE